MQVDSTAQKQEARQKEKRSNVWAIVIVSVGAIVAIVIAGVSASKQKERQQEML